MDVTQRAWAVTPTSKWLIATGPGQSLEGDPGVETGRALASPCMQATWQGLSQPVSQGSSALKVGSPAWGDMLGIRGPEGNCEHIRISLFGLPGEGWIDIKRYRSRMKMAGLLHRDEL